MSGFKFRLLAVLENHNFNQVLMDRLGAEEYDAFGIYAVRVDDYNRAASGVGRELTGAIVRHALVHKSGKDIALDQDIADEVLINCLTAKLHGQEFTTFQAADLVLNDERFVSEIELVEVNDGFIQASKTPANYILRSAAIALSAGSVDIPVIDAPMAWGEWQHEQAPKVIQALPLFTSLEMTA